MTSRQTRTLRQHVHAPPHTGAPWSGSRSMAYRRRTMYMSGTPGILRILRRSSRSHVATMKHLCAVTRCTRQSSAYVPECEHGRRSNRGSRATLCEAAGLVSERRAFGVRRRKDVPKRDPVAVSKLLQLCHHAVGHAGDTWKGVIMRPRINRMKGARLNPRDNELDSIHSVRRGLV